MRGYKYHLRAPHLGDPIDDEPTYFIHLMAKYTCGCHRIYAAYRAMERGVLIQTKDSLIYRIMYGLHVDDASNTLGHNTLRTKFEMNVIQA